MNPMAWWCALPTTTREPIKSYVVSSGYTVWSSVVAIIVFGYTSPEVHCCTSFGSTVDFLRESWWSVILGSVFGIGPVARARQGLAKAKTAQAANDSGT